MAREWKADSGPRAAWLSLPVPGPEPAVSLDDLRGRGFVCCPARAHGGGSAARQAATALGGCRGTAETGGPFRAGDLQTASVPGP